MSSTSRSDLKKVYRYVCNLLNLDKERKRLLCALLSNCKQINPNILIVLMPTFVSRLDQLRQANLDGKPDCQSPTENFDIAIAKIEKQLIKQIMETPELDSFRDGTAEIVTQSFSEFDSTLVANCSPDSNLSIWVQSGIAGFDGKIIDQMSWPDIPTSKTLKSIKRLMRCRADLIMECHNYSLDDSASMQNSFSYPAHLKGNLSSDVYRTLCVVLSERWHLDCKFALAAKGDQELNDNLRFVIIACGYVLGNDCPPENKISNFAHKWRKHQRELFGWNDDVKSEWSLLI